MHSEFCNPADHYPHRIEHVMAPSLDQFAGQTELLDELARNLPLTEAAEILGPGYQAYLWQMCRQYGNPRTFRDNPQHPVLALPYAAAMIATNPSQDLGREIRSGCLAHAIAPDYRALLADYDWLARRPLRGRAYWTHQLRDADHDPEHTEYLIDYRTNEDLHRRTHYCLASAWAYYHLWEFGRAAEAFARGFEQPARDSFDFDPEWPVDLLPPVPDHDYLRWQVDEQLRDRAYESIPQPVKYWLGMALRTMSPEHCDRR